jgi:hypothetical protein
MVAFTQTQDTAVAIYVSGNPQAGYRIRYEIRRELESAVRAAIDARLRKSFSLGGAQPDATLPRAAEQKARLMQTILRSEFGLTSTIITVI